MLPRALLSARTDFYHMTEKLVSELVKEPQTKICTLTKG